MEPLLHIAVQCPPLRAGEGPGVHALDPDGAPPGGIQPQHQLEHGALSRAGPAGQGSQLSLPDLHI